MTGARGEAFLEDGGERVAVLYTNRALAEVERATGKSVLSLAHSIESLAVGDVAQLLLAGMEAARRDARAGGRAYTINDAYAVLDRLGFATVAMAVVEAVTAVLTYQPGEEADANPPA